MRVFAGIVTYNPQIDRLIENVEAIAPQVERIVVFDNGSANLSEVEDALRAHGDSSDVIANGANAGMAHALNVLCERAKAEGVDYILLLDQDSVAPEGFVDLLCEHTGEDVGITAPFVMDRNNVRHVLMDEAVEQTDMVITSGSLVNLDIWERVGGYDENLFVDWVDYEYCDALLLQGYRILKVRDAVLLHEIGKKQYSRMGWSFTFEKGFFRWPVYQDDRPFIRRYDKVKAQVYVTLKYRWTSRWGHEMWFYAYEIWCNLYRGNKKLEYLRAWSKGAFDGSVLALRAHARRGKARPVNRDR